MNVMSELILQSFTMISIVTLMEFFFETFRYFQLCVLVRYHPFLTLW